MTQTTLAEPTPASAHETAQSPIKNSAATADLARIKYGTVLLLATFVLLGAVFGVAITQFSAAADVVAVVGAVTTFVGTILGGHFGVQAGTPSTEAAHAGRARAEAERAKTEQALRVALSKLDPEAAAEVIELLFTVRSGPGAASLPVRPRQPGGPLPGDRVEQHDLQYGVGRGFGPSLQELGRWL
jgi:hypothetical protein